MEIETFRSKGCYTCGGHNFEQPRIPLDPENGNMPVRDPYLLCMDCTSEYPFPDIDLLDDESWEYGKRHREGQMAIPTVYYQSKAQFDPLVAAKGFVTKDEEDVPRPG